ncbi:MAG TPA: 50S ribosomal protein L3 [Candidatus Saccharimonadales bacterium]|nr:50S ribosomal protein L3 [Candidatus Saccharimonadales bacterium]
MKMALLGRKLGMTQVYNEKGDAVPVTVLEAGPCPVVQVKDPKKDGYAALQITFGKARTKNTPAALRGHYAKAKVDPGRRLREVRLEGPSEHQVGQALTVEMFEVGSLVDVSGITKGRGFAGVVRRHHFTGGKATHGCTTHKLPGSIGASAYPSRVIKNKRLPGHMGAENATAKNLKVVGIDKERNLLWVRGSVPGHVNGFVVIRRKG